MNQIPSDAEHPFIAALRKAEPEQWAMEGLEQIIKNGCTKIAREDRNESRIPLSSIDIDEVARETASIITKKIQAGSNIQHIISYAMKTARNIYRAMQSEDHWRDFDKNTKPIIAIPGIPNFQLEPHEQSTLHRLLVQIVFASLQHEKSDYQRMFELHYAEDMRQEQVADLFDIDKSVLKRRLDLIRIRINKLINKCLERLTRFRHLLFYVRFDRSKGRKKSLKSQKTLHQVHEEAFHILQAALAAIKAGEAPQLPLHDAEPLQLDWSQVQAPDPLDIDVMRQELEATLHSLLDCVRSTAPVKGGKHL